MYHQFLGDVILYHEILQRVLEVWSESTFTNTLGFVTHLLIAAPVSYTLPLLIANGKEATGRLVVRLCPLLDYSALCNVGIATFLLLRCSRAASTRPRQQWIYDKPTNDHTRVTYTVFRCTIAYRHWRCGRVAIARLFSWLWWLPVQGRHVNIHKSMS
jgi:hypothetical protein